MSLVEAHEVDAGDAAVPDRLDGLGDGVAADVLGEVVERAAGKDRQRDTRFDRDARRARHGAVAAADGEHLGPAGRLAQHLLDVVVVAEFDDLGLRQGLADLVDDARARAAARRRVDHQHHACAVGALLGCRPAAGPLPEAWSRRSAARAARRAPRCRRRCRTRRAHRPGSARRWPPGTGRPGRPAAPGRGPAAGSPGRRRPRTPRRWRSARTAASSRSACGDRRRASGTRCRFGRGRVQTRLATWLVTRLVTARVTTPRAAPRCADGLPSATIAAAIANHSLEWSAARVSRGITASSSGLGDSAMASNTSRSSVPRPWPICWMPRRRRRKGGLHVANLARCGDLRSCLKLDLTRQSWHRRRWSGAPTAGSLCAAAVCLTAAPTAHAEYTPWFAPQVGNATQVISVVGVGGSSAKIDVFQRNAAGWQPVPPASPRTSARTGMPPRPTTAR